MHTHFCHSGRFMLSIISRSTCAIFLQNCLKKTERPCVLSANNFRSNLFFKNYKVITKTQTYDAQHRAVNILQWVLHSQRLNVAHTLTINSLCPIFGSPFSCCWGIFWITVLYWRSDINNISYSFMFGTSQFPLISFLKCGQLLLAEWMNTSRQFDEIDYGLLQSAKIFKQKQTFKVYWFQSMAVWKSVTNWNLTKCFS